MRRQITYPVMYATIPAMMSFPSLRHSVWAGSPMRYPVVAITVRLMLEPRIFIGKNFPGRIPLAPANSAHAGRTLFTKDDSKIVRGPCFSSKKHSIFWSRFRGKKMRCPCCRSHSRAPRRPHQYKIVLPRTDKRSASRTNSGRKISPLVRAQTATVNMMLLLGNGTPRSSIKKAIPRIQIP